MTSVVAKEGHQMIDGESRYGIFITSLVDPEHPIDQEIRHINEALINWLRHRGPLCERVVLIYIARPDSEATILDFTQRLLGQAIPEAATLRKCHVDVLFGDDAGNTYKQMVLKPPADN